MQVGINWTSSGHLSMVQSFLSSGTAGFCEILIDNFLHLEPTAVKDIISGYPVAFHIMWSRFLERDRADLERIALRLRTWIETIQPLYVSDHLAHFTYQGRRLPLLMELDYETEYDDVKSRVEQWQELLGCQIAIENFPSTLNSQVDQVSFYDRLLSEAGCDLLFDISNAIVAQRNGAIPISAWHTLAAKSSHFHVAGFRLSDTQPSIAIDTHDVALSPGVIDAAVSVFRSNTNLNNITITVERDANIDYESWKLDLEKIKEIYVRSPSIPG